MKEIQLTRGKIAKVDDEDFPLLSQYSWCCFVNKYKGKEKYYAQTRINNVAVYMHRLLVKPSPDMEVDHINGDGLDNRRENLRLATRSQQMQNSAPRKGSSRFKGVVWHKTAKKWMAQITCDNKLWYLGLHKTEEEAAKAYDEAAILLHGEFARLNLTP